MLVCVCVGVCELLACVCVGGLCFCLYPVGVGMTLEAK